MPIETKDENSNEENKVVSPEEGEVKTETTNEQAQTNPFVEKATAHGWMPKEEWIEAGNDEDDWKPAKTFVEYGEMLGKIRNQSKELQDTRNALQHVATKNKEIYEKGYQAALTQLRTQKRAALADGDFVKADELEERIDATKEELAQVRRQPVVPQNKQNQPDPEHVEWVQRNEWYNQPVMQKFADALAVEYIRVNNGQVTPSDVRDFVEKEVKKEFAHKFQNRSKSAPNPDGEGRSTGKADTGNKLDAKLSAAKANMSDQERSIMKTMIKSAGLTEKEYLQMYLG